MSTALFINGIYNGVLSEILDAQNERGGGHSFLQPYKGEIIRVLKKRQPTPVTPIRLYASTTDNLSQICYTADIIGWEDKRDLPEQRRREVSTHLEEYQPGEADYFKGFKKDEKKEINLITIKNLIQLETLHSTSILRKVSDGTPLKKRTRSGGWSEVYDVGDLYLRTETQEQFDSDLATAIKGSMGLSDDDLKERLTAASRLPEKVQVVSSAYRRNPDVIVAVLRRADGFCERCGNKAPFSRRSDGSPYLEVHHWRSLSKGGEDTVENAVALCPNCHREFHYGEINAQ